MATSKKDSEVFGDFINESGRVANFAEWVERERVEETGDGLVDEDYNQALFLGSETPSGAYIEIENMAVPFPEGSWIMVDGDYVSITLSRFLKGFGFSEESKFIDFEHVDTKNGLIVKGRCSFRKWMRGKEVVATDYRYGSMVGEAEGDLRPLGCLIVRVEQKILGAKCLRELNNFR